MKLYFEDLQKKSIVDVIKEEMANLGSDLGRTISVSSPPSNIFQKEIIVSTDSNIPPIELRIIIDRCRLTFYQYGNLRVHKITSEYKDDCIEIRFIYWQIGPK